jgi:fatty-acyl-CoA synthase
LHSSTRHLTGTALAYCINAVTPKHIIVAAELLASLESARAHSHRRRADLAARQRRCQFPRIDREIDGLSGTDVAASDLPALSIEDGALYIYTSGTTGLPKAANMNHYRLMLASNAFAGVMDTRASDRMYDCLPLYHTAGGVVATGALLVRAARW